jgi:hypothetical protein
MNLYGAKAKSHMAQFRPQEYHQINDKEAYFTEIGEEAQRQVSSTYSKISRPELGQRDLASKMMAEELIHELIYPVTPEQMDGPTDLDSVDLDSVVAFCTQVQQDLWAQFDSDQADNTTSPLQER